METFIMFASCHLEDAYCLFLCWEAITKWQVALLTFVCVYLSYEEKNLSQGQVNVPECFKYPTKSICYSI